MAFAVTYDLSYLTIFLVSQSLLNAAFPSFLFRKYIIVV